jgi:hypothetical protein
MARPAVQQKQQFNGLIQLLILLLALALALVLLLLLLAWVLGLHD